MSAVLVHRSSTTPFTPRPVQVDLALEGLPSMGLTTFFVVTDLCLACSLPVDLDNQATFSLCRVGGDSANGYEPLHRHHRDENLDDPTQ